MELIKNTPFYLENNKFLIDVIFFYKDRYEYILIAGA